MKIEKDVLDNPNNGFGMESWKEERKPRKKERKQRMTREIVQQDFWTLKQNFYYFEWKPKT